MTQTKLFSTTLLASAAIAVSAFSTASQAVPFTISNGGLTTDVTTIKGTDSAVDFYDYHTLSAHTGLERSDAAVFWLYESTTTGDISLGFTFDAINDGSGGYAALQTSGMPDTAFIEVSDDPGEAHGIINGYSKWSWANCCTDGAVIGGLEGDWSMTFDFVKDFNLSNWFFAGDASGETMWELDMSETLTIQKGTPVPEPAPLLLAIAGMGMILTRRRLLS